MSGTQGDGADAGSERHPRHILPAKEEKMLETSVCRIILCLKRKEVSTAGKKDEDDQRKLELKQWKKLGKKNNGRNFQRSQKPFRDIGEQSKALIPAS